MNQGDRTPMSHGRFPDLPAVEVGANQGEPRDVLADRISTWVEEDEGVYSYADRLILDLYKADYDIVSRASVRQEEEAIATRIRQVRKLAVCRGLDPTDDEIAEALDAAEEHDLIHAATNRLRLSASLDSGSVS